MPSRNIPEKFLGREDCVFVGNDFSLALLPTDTIDFFLPTGLGSGVTVTLIPGGKVPSVCFLRFVEVNSDFILCPDPMETVSESSEYFSLTNNLLRLFSLLFY